MSADTTHTPGPWEVSRWCRTLVVFDDKRGMPVLVADASAGFLNAEQRAPNTAVAHANAHLIASAPGLLEALKFALRESGCDGDLCAHEWHDRARAAIAKAEGWI